MTASEPTGAARDLPLDPIDRLTEVMFGLLMALTFTGTASVTIGQGGTVNGILLAAIGCNIAWGIVDAMVYTLSTVTERARGRARVLAIRQAGAAESRRMVRDLLPGTAGEDMAEADVATIAGLIRDRPLPPPRRLDRSDARAAGMIFLMVTSATWPPILPFLLVGDVHLAMRLSNLIAVAMLFGIGYLLDRQIDAGSHTLRWVVPVIGTVMVAVTVVLGG
jgi:VIT1/CCC1 family predicted Fe2+/Mn2+ transporter